MEREETYFANFNPRSREGSDRGKTHLAIAIANFNPRSREGSDISVAKAEYALVYFNPRSREGSDAIRFHLTFSYLVFQSTLP